MRSVSALHLNASSYQTSAGHRHLWVWSVLNKHSCRWRCPVQLLSEETIGGEPEPTEGRWSLKEGRRRKGRGGKRGQAERREPGGGRWRIYGLKLLNYKSKISEKRSHKDDHSVLPGEFLGRCCSLYSVFTPELLWSCSVLFCCCAPCQQESDLSEGCVIRPLAPLSAVSGAAALRSLRKSPSAAPEPQEELLRCPHTWLQFLGHHYFTTPGFGPLENKLTWLLTRPTHLVCDWLAKARMECLWSSLWMPLDSWAVNHSCWPDASLSSSRSFSERPDVEQVGEEL